MAFELAAQAIESRFSTAWAATTLVKYENDEFDPPAGSTYVEFVIREGATFQKDLAKELQRIRNTGLIVATIFFAPDIGTRAARALLTPLKAIFDGKSFVTVADSGGRTYTVHTGSDGRSQAFEVKVLPRSGGWERLQVMIPYWWDSFRS